MFIINGREEEGLNLDSGFFFGRALFETLLVKEKPIFLNEHIERLNNALKILNIDKKVSIKDIEALINKFNIKNTVLKIVVSEKNLILTTREFNYDKETYEKGFKLGISKVIRNSSSRLTYIKSTNYIENILEREEGLKNDFQEVLFLNEKEKVTEGSFSNLFFIKNKEIFTPNKQDGLLGGIMRQWILKNYKVTVGSYTLEDIYEADEVFLTNSVFGIMKVKNIVFNEEIKNYEDEIVTRIQKNYFKHINFEYL